MFLKPSCDRSSVAMVVTGSRKPYRLTHTCVTCWRGFRDSWCRELQIIGGLHLLTIHPEANHQCGHKAQCKSFHRRSPFLVETHIRRAQMAANMMATAGQAISTIINTRGVSAAHCIH
jgi:hypothetical protein